MRPLLVSGLAVLIALGVVACASTATPMTPIQNATPTDVELQRILFTSDRDGNLEIYVMDADGSNPTRLTDNSTEDALPYWSPEGSKIAFCTFSGDPESKVDAWISVIEADGSNQVRLTDTAAFFDCGPAWSPDGTKVAFASRRDDNVDIYVVDADGANETRLTNDPADDTGPQWSPDGSKIVFSSGLNSSDPKAMVFVNEIYVMDADSSNKVRLTDTPSNVDNIAPAWSPEGSKIAFLSDREESLVAQLYLIDADGSNQTRLTNHPANIQYFSWSPDGRKIAFLSETENFVEEIYVMDADGANQTLLTTRDFRGGMAVTSRQVV